jgi:hypothetical protein
MVLSQLPCCWHGRLRCCKSINLTGHVRVHAPGDSINCRLCNMHMVLKLTLSYDWLQQLRLLGVTGCNHCNCNSLVSHAVIIMHRKQTQGTQLLGLLQHPVTHPNAAHEAVAQGWSAALHATASCTRKLQKHSNSKTCLAFPELLGCLSAALLAHLWFNSRHAMCCAAVTTARDLFIHNQTHRAHAQDAGHANTPPLEAAVLLLSRDPVAQQLHEPDTMYNTPSVPRTLRQPERPVQQLTGALLSCA